MTVSKLISDFAMAVQQVSRRGSSEDIASLAAARAALEAQCALPGVKPPPPAARPDGWAILTAQGDTAAFHPRVSSFFGARLEADAPKFNAEYISREDRENPGNAPHRCVEVFFSAIAA